jgi:hypothetical protein
MAALVAAIHVFEHARYPLKTWMPGTRPRLSGQILVDEAHGVDSSWF